MKNNSIVLVVDDEPIGLEVVRALLYDESYTLHFASNGMEALAQAEKLRPDLILLDVLMPGMSGYDVCRTIRKTAHLADIPIILLTALNDRDAKLRGIDAGADDFITKPFDRLELSVRVRTILRLNRYRRINTERAKFAWVVDSAEEGYLLLDADDNIEYANPKARQLLGINIDPDTPVEHAFLDIARRQYQLQPSHAWELWPAPSQGMVRQLVRPQSEITNTLWLQVDLMASDMTADVFLVRLRDVTHEIAQQRLRWSFHSQIQHKFRHPLTLLTGHLELLAEAGDDLSSAERTFLTNNAYKASKRFNHEVLAVLEYLNVATEAPQQVMLISVADAIDIAEKLDSQMMNFTLDIASNVRNPQEIKLPFSAEQIESVLWELFQNSQKFHPVQAPHVILSVKHAHDRVCIQVKDNGQYLAPDQLRQMWTPYYQAERFYTGQVPGMGLGLPMVASQIWSVGGHCTAYNRPDIAGLAIELSFPIA